MFVLKFFFEIFLASCLSRVEMGVRSVVIGCVLLLPCVLCSFWTGYHMAYSGCRTCLSVAPVVIKKSTVDCIPLLSSSCGTDVTKHLAAGVQMEEKNGTSCFTTLENSNLAWRRICCVVRTAALDIQGNLHAKFLVLPAHRGAVDVALTDCT